MFGSRINNYFSLLLAVALASMFMLAPTAFAANITKAGSGTDLTAGASWTCASNLIMRPNFLIIG